VAILLSRESKGAANWRPLWTANYLESTARKAGRLLGSSVNAFSCCRDCLA